MTDAILPSLEAAVEDWNGFNWNERLAEVDIFLQQTKEVKEQSLQARKNLAEITKQLKRSVKSVETTTFDLKKEANPESVASSIKSMESLTKECRVTVKSYQEEIDNLTRRCKTSESSYVSLCQALSEQSEPAAILASALQHIHAQQAQMTQLLSTVEHVNQELQSQETMNVSYRKEIASLQKSKSNSSGNAGVGKADREELAQLRREVAEYEIEFRSLKNQDITIRRLEARIAELQTVGEEQLKEELEKHKEELQESEGRKVAEALEREAAMERKVQTLELQLQAERAGREATQGALLDADEGVSQREAAWEAQRRILVDDAERVRESLQTATRERDELRLKMAAVSENTTPEPSPPSGGLSVSDLILERKAYEAEVAELSETANMLREELRTKELQVMDEKRISQVKLSNLERQVATLSFDLSTAQSQLHSAPSQALVDNMKRELRILKRLEYNADDVDTERDPEIAGGNAGDEDDKDLESVLVAKLRRAESDLVTERVSRTSLIEDIETLKKSMLDAEKTNNALEKLVASLERDLERAIATPSAATSRKQSEHVLVEENPATLEHILDPNAAPPLPPPPPPSARSQSESESQQDDHSVATIVMAQRDRLRARCEALEAERDSFKRELQGQVQASEHLKTDNTKLYEKVRYLQNYNKPPSSGHGTAYSRSVSAGDRDLDLEALEQRYEASVDPFRQFSKAERQRKLNEMSPMERTVFIVAKTFLATKEMRTALFFYVVAMHLLVFITTYHWSQAAGCIGPNKDYLSHLPPTMPKPVTKEEAPVAGAAAIPTTD
jgi:homeobox protein cut-like